jgi:mycothiol synthase
MTTTSPDAVPGAAPTPIPGLTFRGVEHPSDYAGMAAVYNDSNAIDGVGLAISGADLERVYVGAPNLDPAHDLHLAVVDRRIVSYSLTNRWDDLKGVAIYYHNTFTVAGWRDKGIEPASLRWAESRLRAMAATDPAPRPRVFESRANGAVPARDALLRAEGYHVVYRSQNLARPDLEAIPEAPLPPGIELRPAQPEQYRAIWDAMLEASSELSGMTVVTDADYRHYAAGPFFQPQLWQVAWDGDQIAGSILNYVNEAENQTRGAARGYAQDLTVRAPWRRRGIGRALLAGSLKLHRDRGMREAAMMLFGQEVDGCRILYTSMGFRAVAECAYYQKPLV